MTIIDIGSKTGRGGFALVVTLSLMILLTIIAVGLLSLSAVTLRSSSQGVAQAEAQANARLALMLAIGELQKQLGPDQRVSANGAILATTTVQHPNWAGVWNSWQAGTRAAGTTSPDTPSEHRTILGAANNGMSPTYVAQRGDHFRAWLVSLSQNQAADISSARNLSLTGTAKPSATDNAVQLVGLKSLGPEANVVDHVKVGLLPIQSSNGDWRAGKWGWTLRKPPACRSKGRDVSPRRPSEWDANEWNGSGARSSRHRQNWLGANIALMQPDIDLRESEATFDSTSFRV